MTYLLAPRLVLTQVQRVHVTRTTREAIAAAGFPRWAEPRVLGWLVSGHYVVREGRTVRGFIARLPGRRWAALRPSGEARAFTRRADAVDFLLADARPVSEALADSCGRRQ